MPAVPADPANLRILIVNDDGVHALGIERMESFARGLSDDVWIVAPEYDQSGTGHSLTLVDPIRIRQLGEKRFAVRGTPTDCVVMARNQIMQDALPNLLLSGVNRGLNAAEDVTYSGTIAGAMEATLLGIPAICLSQAFRDRNDVKWQTAERHGPDLLARLVAHGWPADTFLNVNFPAVEPDEVKGVRITRQGQRGQSSLQITDRIDARGFPYYWLHLDHEKNVYPEDTDLAALDADYISVTPLQLDLTNHAAMDSLHAALAEPAPVPDKTGD